MADLRWGYALTYPHAERVKAGTAHEAVGSGGATSDAAHP